MSFTSSFLPLDGVEFKISDSLQVPTVEGLSPQFRMNDPTNLLLESEYDFSKENEALFAIEAKRLAERKMAEQEEKRRQLSLKRREEAEKQKVQEMIDKQREVLQRQRELFLEQKRRQQERAEIENETADRTATNEEQGTSKTSPVSEIAEADPPPLPPRNFFSQIGKDNILTPLPAARKSQDLTISPTQQRLNQSQPVVSGQNQIWVDFEDKELDPFTNMELKTIDDMAELQSVLQNAKLEPPSITDDHLPTYEEVTSTSLSDPPKESPVSLAPSSSTSAPSTVETTTPLYVDVEEMSSKLRTIINSESRNSSNSESSSPNSVTSPSYGNVKLQPTVETNRSSSPEFSVPKNTTELYENVTTSEVVGIAKKLEQPDIRTLKINAESVYEFAEELDFSQKEDKTSQIRSIFERNLSQKVDENDPKNSDTLYSVIRPKTRAAKSPDNKTPTPSLTTPVSVPTAFGSFNPVLTGYPPSQSPDPSLSKSTETISSVLPRPVRPRPDATGIQVQGHVRPQGQNIPSTSLNQLTGTKVLPVSFGTVPNSLSTPVLPPITSKNHANDEIYMNVTSGSTSVASFLGPSPIPRRPPIPPRDPVMNFGPTTRGQPILPSPIKSPPNGVSPSIPTTGHSHLMPPYALPQSNGPSVTMSSASVAFTNSKPAIPPKKSKSAPSTADTSFIQKTNEDRAKFTETVNKALSSLPKNPQPVVKHKPTLPSQSDDAADTKLGGKEAFSNYPSLPTKAHSPSPKSSILSGLSTEERDFVSVVTAMGFEIQATMRATQKYGLNVKEVVDHLCTVQQIVDQGFTTSTVQDALDLFENDNKSVIKYLHHASQLVDMGFKENDVRQALKSCDNDQTRALDMLMGQT